MPCPDHNTETTSAELHQKFLAEFQNVFSLLVDLIDSNCGIQKLLAEFQNVFSLLVDLISSNCGIQKLLAEIQKILAKIRK